jgi:glycine hydroxymethyltransferase
MDEIAKLIKAEEKRQKTTIMMIPSENYTYPEVRHAVGSWLMHKYSEGYPGRRYYQGNSLIDKIENIAIDNAKKVFGVPHVNVQPYSGSPANAAVYMALLKPGETLMGMDLSSGGHLTHGHPNITFSGKYFQSVQYGVGDDGYMDFELIRKLAKKHKPKVLVCGLTAYPRVLEFEKFAAVADEVGAYLVADISHIAGLIAAGVHQSPAQYAHIITTTTHKTLRGPRGAIIMVTDKGVKKNIELPKLIDRAVFPGMQGGPHDNTTAGIAIALEYATQPEFREYGKRIIENAAVLAEELKNYGFELAAGGTDNHLILVDLRNKNISGKDAAVRLESAGIIVNFNSVPNDPSPPSKPSGIRLGTPALTTRGMGKAEMKIIAGLIERVISRESEVEKANEEVKKLCKNYPVR